MTSYGNFKLESLLANIEDCAEHMELLITTLFFCQGVGCFVFAELKHGLGAFVSKQHKE